MHVIVWHHEGYKQMHLLCKCQNQVGIKERAKQERWKASSYFTTPSSMSLCSRQRSLHQLKADYETVAAAVIFTAFCKLF